MSLLRVHNDFVKSYYFDMGIMIPIVGVKSILTLKNSIIFKPTI